LVANEPGRLAFALRLTLACCTTGLIVQWFEIPEPALTVYLVLFLNRPERMTSILLAVVMLAFVSVLIALLIPLAAFLIDGPFWRVLAMAGLSFGIVFVGSASRLRPFAPTMALITAYVLAMLGSVPAGELATRGLLYAWLFVAVPAGVSIAADLVLAPAPRRQGGALLARALGCAVELLDRPAPATREGLRAVRRQVVLHMPVLLKLARMEGTIARDDGAAFSAAAASTLRVLAACDLLDRYPDTAARTAIVQTLTPTLRAMADILRAGGYPVAIARPCWPVSIPDDLAPIIVVLSEALTGFATPAPPPPPQPPESSVDAPTPSSGFFSADAFTNPEHVQHALKVTLAAMTCYLLYALWDWPGIHTAMITCYIVALGTAAETAEKLSLRIVGCLVGAALGLATIVFVMPGVASITGLLSVVAGGMLLASWVAAGDARIAYAGFQIGFAFLLCVLQGSAPDFDLSIARDRVVGVLLGTTISYLVFTRIWPVSVTRGIDLAIDRLLALVRITQGAAVGARQPLIAKAVATTTDLQRQLDLAAFEPRSLRPPARWIADRRRLLHRIEPLEALLLLAQPEAHGSVFEPSVQMQIAELAAAVAALAPLRPDDASVASDSLGDGQVAQRSGGQA
jgi:multidrug resistance protein MdtO